MQIAVLALQGAFIEHEQMLERLGVSSVEIRQKRDLERPYDGLIIPGGESTVQGKLMRELGLFEPIKKQIEQGLPVFGTCAGLLLLPCAELFFFKLNKELFGFFCAVKHIVDCLLRCVHPVFSD